MSDASAFDSSELQLRDGFLTRLFEFSAEDEMRKPSEARPRSRFQLRRNADGDEYLGFIERIPPPEFRNCRFAREIKPSSVRGG